MVTMRNYLDYVIHLQNRITLDVFEILCKMTLIGQFKYALVNFARIRYVNLLIAVIKSSDCTK